ncbi:HWE histidine kinase domain-containing protein [Roseobacter sp.]|uniref:HWE histidine kinase domain-containing protein n=1 Tax=Roseobacter sp. TaxID=1907202 RepID=UPI00385E34D7
MTQPLTEEQLREALKTCADEPVHIPGSIQPIGFLLACDFDGGIVRQASENCPDLFGLPLADILGRPLRSLLGADISHNLNNIRGMGGFANARHFAGVWQTTGKEYAVHFSKGGERFVIEIEEAGTVPKTSYETSQQQAFLVSQIEGCDTLPELFDLTTDLLHHLTSFDRVTVIKFDKEWNGEVVSEARSRRMDPLLGLRFPSHDVPAQARDLMRQIPMRLICDVEQIPIPLVAHSADEPALDMTFAANRGVSPIHMQYLHNFGLGATMTLSVILGDELWGMISFHSLKPRVAPPEMRHLLLSFMPLFQLKLDLLRREKSLKLSQQVDQLQTDVQGELEKGSELEAMMQQVGPSIIDVLDATGVVMTNGSEYFGFGKVPETSIIEFLAERVNAAPDKLLAIDNLSSAFPELASHLDGLAGALLTGYEGTRSLQVYRPEISQSVAWAGNPTKTVEAEKNTLRIEPRSSFSKYLLETAHKSKAWSGDDIHLMRQLWPLLSAAERRAFLSHLSRQQQLMINELNHRVRNILALVKSVSSEARRSGGSLESYSNAIESRIHALAAAHDIGAGAANSSVSIFDIIKLEANPYSQEDAQRVFVSGEDANIRAESAPIFALVIHELMTNAVKYGALAVPNGRIDLEVRRNDDGLRVDWFERDGPRINTKPKRQGFGTTLILQAVPFEMGGTADLRFCENGVEATLTLPPSAFGDAPVKNRTQNERDNQLPSKTVTALRNGLVLLVEDNFMVANAMRTVLENAGFVSIEMLSGVDPAMEFLQVETPTFAALDINLGQGVTSEPIASELLRRNVPFIFVTGYGEQHSLAPHLNNVPTLTKPITRRELLSALDSLVI